MTDAKLERLRAAIKERDPRVCSKAAEKWNRLYPQHFQKMNASATHFERYYRVYEDRKDYEWDEIERVKEWLSSQENVDYEAWWETWEDQSDGYNRTVLVVEIPDVLHATQFRFLFPRYHVDELAIANDTWYGGAWIRIHSTHPTWTPGVQAAVDLQCEATRLDTEIEYLTWEGPEDQDWIR